MFPSLPASAIADALVNSGGDSRLAVERLLAEMSLAIESEEREKAKSIARKARLPSHCALNVAFAYVAFNPRAGGS